MRLLNLDRLITAIANIFPGKFPNSFLEFMIVKKNKDNTFVIRIKRGEKIIDSITAFCQKEKIFGGFFFGLGAVDYVNLAHYDVKSKKYSRVEFKEPLELVSITGSIGKEKEIIVHAHAVLADNKMKTIGGHLVEAIVSGTAEIYLIKLPQLKKQYDPETGLKLFVFNQ